MTWLRNEWRLLPAITAIALVTDGSIGWPSYFVVGLAVGFARSSDRR